MIESLSASKESSKIDRRSLLCRAGLGGASLLAGGLLAGCGGDSHNRNDSSSNSGVSDVDVLNFALNLEYLEASYYTIGTGQYLLGDTDVAGAGTPGTVNGGSQVAFGSLGPYFQEIAFDESNHVRAVRAAILARGGTPVARPAIDFATAFPAAGASAGNPGFDPFANETNFLLGAFLLSDVGATAYVGGSQYLNADEVKLAAARILAVEGYHVGSIRTLIANVGGAAVTQSQGIANARNNLDNIAGAPVVDDQGVDADPNVPGAHNIALTDAQGLAYPRSFSQVLAIAYLSNANGTASGGFFPNGTNGSIRAVVNPGNPD